MSLVTQTEKQPNLLPLCASWSVPCTHSPLHALPVMQVSTDGTPWHLDASSYMPLSPHCFLPQLPLFCTSMSSRALLLKVWPRICILKNSQMIQPQEIHVVWGALDGSLEQLHLKCMRQLSEFDGVWYSYWKFYLKPQEYIHITLGNPYFIHPGRVYSWSPP